MEARLGPLRAEGAEPTSSPVLEHLCQLACEARSPSRTAMPPAVLPHCRLCAGRGGGLVPGAVKLPLCHLCPGGRGRASG